MMQEITIKTQRKAQMIDVTSQVSAVIGENGIKEGLAVVFVPHTTAGITINENADPDVVHDMLLSLDELVPEHNPGYRHGEGNSDGHVKASLIGSSVTVIVKNSRLALGTWQGIYFCEFDGPRNRKLWIKLST